MRSLPAGPLGLLVVISVTACQATPDPTTSGVPSGTPAPVDADPSPPDAGTTIDPDWITRPALTCGDPERRFPPEALGNPDYPTTLFLPEPLGNRTLLDANSYPPRTVTRDPQ